MVEKAQQGARKVSLEQRRDLQAGYLDLEVICVQMAMVTKWVTWTVTGVAHFTREMAGHVLQVAHLVLIACQGLFLISYEMLVILLAVNQLLSKDSYFQTMAMFKVFQKTQK